MSATFEEQVYPIKLAANRLAEWADDISQETFEHNRMMHAAVARKVSFIGAHCRQLAADYPQVAQSFPEIAAWIALGEQLEPAPLVEDGAVLWQALEDMLPTLVVRMRGFLPDDL